MSTIRFLSGFMWIMSGTDVSLRNLLEIKFMNRLVHKHCVENTDHRAFPPTSRWIKDRAARGRDFGRGEVLSSLKRERFAERGSGFPPRTRNPVRLIVY